MVGFQVPLTFVAEFRYTSPAGVFERVPLAGSGTGTIVFTGVFPPAESNAAPLWVYAGLEYHITPPACTSKSINDAVSVSINSTSFDPTPVPNGPAGTYFIQATLTNTSAEPVEGPIKFVVSKLTGNNRLLSSTEGDARVGSKQIVSPTLSQGASVKVAMTVGLTSRNPFDVLVDVEACASVDGDD